ncbi:vacuolar protein sorting-associated protein 26C-like [Lytechinus variegatus]|uniref:vacuolar protein sorting-associated protein 26C-like n=1 Tax=Lytechinus variegatus TaxID=7654 RepID=UPI001BB0F0FB|nr:vacuolar protein sorting-associated protein 26C-like [Lytechinus variegatus]
MAALIDIRLKKANKIYNEGDVLAGVIVIQTKTEFQHQGITLVADGSVNLQLSSKSVGHFEAFYNSIKPIQLLTVTLNAAKPGKIPAGKTEIPFEVPLKAKLNKTLYETYHGVFVNVQYTLKAQVKRSLLAKDLVKTIEFIIEYRDQKVKAELKPVPFTITPQSLQNVKDKTSLPNFSIKGRLDSASCCIKNPLTGHVIIEQCNAPIKSVEIQLVRVETCGCAEGYARDATEIQNIQIGEGNICRGLTIPMYMVFPRLFTCPTLATSNFKVEFEINLVVVLHDDHLITENFPIVLTRF